MKTVQQILEMSTKTPCLRADVHGWTWEDPRCVGVAPCDKAQKPIGLFRNWVQSEPLPRYDCVLRALADGWKLLGPPTEDKCDTPSGPWAEWSWMLGREVPR